MTNHERAALAAQLATTGGFKGKRYRNMEKQRRIADRMRRSGVLEDRAMTSSVNLHCVVQCAETIAIAARGMPITASSAKWGSAKMLCGRAAVQSVPP